MSANTSRNERRDDGAASGANPRAPLEPERRRPGDDTSELEKKIIETAKVAVPAATVVIASFAGLIMGASATILVLAGGALIAVIAVFWASVRTLLGETPLSGADAYALGAPRAEEEQKRAVLRALKDLEFERSVGKISEEDYAALVLKYRAEAKRLLRALDEDAQPRRDHVEALVQKRLRREGLLDQDDEAEAKPAEDAEDEAKPAEAEVPAAPIKAKKRKKARRDLDPKPLPIETGDPELDALVSEPKAKADAPPADAKVEEAADRVCASCGTVNDVDAVFCKKCGSRREAQGEAEAS